jgi:triosephosphate isomerase
MTRKLVVGNWKMNLDARASAALAREICTKITPEIKTEVWLTPSFTALTSVAAELQGTAVRYGAQNVHWEDKGAYTGEISAPMLKELGCTFVIVGHSERRTLFGDTTETVAKRAAAAFRHQLNVVFCVGETLEQRNNGQTNQVLEQQLNPLISLLQDHQLDLLTIAYEPVWAIGTGVIASAEQISEAHQAIHRYITKHFAKWTGRVLYGGSVAPDNFAEIVALNGVGGGLPGGASLKSQSFVELVQIASEV